MGRLASLITLSHSAGITVQAGFRPGPAAGHRRQGHRRRHHRHAQPLARARHDLGPAGRQARVRREAVVSHRVGRPQNGRSGDAVQQGGAGRHDEPQHPGGPPGDEVHPRRRHRQGLHGARPLLQAAAVDRQVPGRPDGARREVRADHRRRPSIEPAYDAAVPRRKSTTTSGSGRPRSSRSTATAFTTTGTGTGTTATATPATRARTSSTSPAGGWSKQEHPVQHPIGGRLLRARVLAGNARRADVALRVRGRHDPGVRHARRVHERRGRRPDRQPVLRLEGLALARRQQVAVVLRTARTRKGRAPIRLRQAAGHRSIRTPSSRTTRTSWTRSVQTTRKS